MVTDRLGENGGKEGKRRRRKGGKGCGGRSRGAEDGLWWEAWVAWAGMRAGWKEDLMNVDHCPST